MKLTKNHNLPPPRKDRAPIYASIWMALFFDLRHVYRLARTTR